MNDCGSKQMVVNSATPIYPTNGRGGSSASPSAAFPNSASYLVEGFTIQATSAAASTLTVFQGDGTTSLFTLQIPIAAAAGQYFPIGGVNGYDASAVGFSAQITSAGTPHTGNLWFRRSA